jgi:phage I-like protein
MQITARITAYRISNGALAQKDLPRKLKFLDWGDSPSLKGTVRVTPLTVQRLPATQQAHRWDRIALDYEHNTLPGTPEFERSQEPRSVAAYGVVVCVPGDGLYLDDIQWTPHGEKFAREYVDLSPAPVQTQDGTVVGVHSIALCRHGAVDGLQFYSVNLNEGDGAMDWKKYLCSILNVTETTSDDDLKTAFGERVKALSADIVKAVADRVAALEAAKPDDSKVVALSAEVVTLTGKIAELAKGIETRDRNDVLCQAAREGKVVALSAEAVAKITIPELKDYVGKLPVTVPVTQRTHDHIQPLSAGISAEDDKALDAVAAACGVDPKKVRESNK